MTPNLLLLIFIQSLVILGLAWIICRWVRSPLVRQGLCRGALVGTLILAVLAPRWGVKEHAIAPISVMPVLQQVAKSMTPATSSSPSQAEAVQPQQVSARGDVKGYDSGKILVPVWYAGIFLCSLHLLLGLAILARLRLKSRLTQDPRLIETTENVCKRLGIRTPNVRESKSVCSPFVVGCVRSTIYVPEKWSEDLSDEALAAFITHEVAHVVRGDLLWKSLLRLSQVVVWFQPFIWMLKKPMSLAAEELCDRHVVASGTQPTQYADNLLKIAERGVSRGYGIGIVSSKKALTKRLEALMQKSHLTQLKLSGRASFGLFTLILCCVVVAASVFGAPKSSNEMQPPPVGVKQIHVKTPDGQPVMTGRALLFTHNPETGGGEHVLPFEKGMVSVDFSKFPSKFCHVVVEAPGYGLTFERRWPSDHPDADLVMNRATVLTGKFVMPDGKPASGIRVLPVQVLVRKPSEDIDTGIDMIRLSVSSLRDLYSTVTQPDGTFVIKGFPQNSEVRLDTNDIRFAMLKFEDRFTLGSSATTILKPFRLTLAATIEGRVTRDGKPVWGIGVGCQNSANSPEIGAHGQTNEHGYYRIERVGPGIANVALDLDNAPYPEYREVNAAAYEGVRIKPGDHIKGMHFALIKGGIIRGRVVDSSGKPVAGANVGVYGPAHPRSSAWVQRAKTDAEGYYLLHVPPGEQYVYLSGGLPASETIKIKDGETREVSFVVN